MINAQHWIIVAFALSTVAFAIAAGAYIGLLDLKANLLILRKENNELIQRMDCVDDGRDVAAVALGDIRRDLIEMAQGVAFHAESIGDAQGTIQTHHDRLVAIERAREDSKGPVQARGVVASRRAIMEMGGAKDLM